MAGKAQKGPQKADLHLPPMTPCGGCGRDAEHESELFILVGSQWVCRGCFHAGPGRSWPRPRPRRPEVATRVNKPPSHKPMPDPGEFFA